MNIFKGPSLVSARAVVVVVLLAGSADVMAAVTAPPLPVGSSQVRIVAGQSPFEQGRMARAHKHHSPSHYKKDMTRDDTLEGSSSRRYGGGVEEPDTGLKSIPR